jgi:hypothetical protein
MLPLAIEFVTKHGAQKAIRMERQMINVYLQVRIMQAATSLGKIKDIRTGQVMKDA